MPHQTLHTQAVELLRHLIRIPSFSREEHETANLIEAFLQSHGMPTHRVLNNIWAVNKHFDNAKPSILLNSHHDTVKPNKGYTRDPYDAAIEDGKLYGLGSNDAGGCLVSLLATFLHYYSEVNLKYNFVFIASAEEEITGANGVELALNEIPPVDFGIVGEPTLLQLAIAEKGLMVVDAVAQGRAGHAAREEGENALYKALEDVEAIRRLPFSRVSDLLGPVKLSVTVMETDNKAHNVVPATCRFTIDCRVNELYTLEEVFESMQQVVQSQLTPRSMRIRSTSISLSHPMVQAGLALGKTCYGSPTTSDKAMMHFPTLKMGPGDSARSHTANEFIFVQEIGEGIDTYIALLDQLVR
jgi:acetylornithine deacetylase